MKVCKGIKNKKCWQNVNTTFPKVQSGNIRCGGLGNVPLPEGNAHDVVLLN